MRPLTCSMPRLSTRLSNPRRPRRAAARWVVATALVWTTGVLLSAQGPGVAPVPAPQPRAFHGPYAGIDVGRQHLIGGSLVDEVDTLQEASRAVAAGFVGLRAQFGGGVVVGAEFAVGRTDGRLMLDDATAGVSVRYDNRVQTQVGGLVGHTLGDRRDWLAFAYAAEVSRNFDVQIVQHGGRVAQQDEQGLLRFGLGIERRVGAVGLRFALGTSRADFGSRVTNITIRRRLDLGIGALWQW